MTIEFEVNIPDEPFKDTFLKGNKAKLTYTGPKFLVVSINSDDKQVCTYEGTFDSLEEINLDDYNQENKQFIILDAIDNPLLASFLTHQYENEEYPDYEEILPTGESWTYGYENHILGNIYNNENPYYIAEEDSFSPLKLLGPAFSRKHFFENINNSIERIEKIVPRDSTVTTAVDNIEELTEYLDWLKNIETTYLDVDHWKIPYRSEPSI
jgi:hypothetical protein